MNARSKPDITGLRMLDAKAASAYIGLGIGTTRALMKEIGAERRFGKRCVYDRKVIDAYLDTLTAETDSVAAGQ